MTPQPADSPEPTLFPLGDADPQPEAQPDRVDLAPTPPAVGDLARSLPANLRMGTSSWSFPGWTNVYKHTHKPADLARSGLPAYAAHPLLRTVALDRAFYAPVPEREQAELAAQTPADFRFVVKAYQALTRPTADDAGRTHGNTADHTTTNPLFLDPAAAEDLVIAPTVRALGPRLGVILFQFPPLDLSPASPVASPEVLVESLAEFLAALPVGPAYAVELRNRAFLERPNLTRALTDTLRAHSTACSLAHHPTLPTIDAQARALASAGYPITDAPHTLIRWMLRHDQTYAGAKARYQPFTDIRDPDVPTRNTIATTALDAIAKPAFIIVNNKAEGSAPHTIARLASHIAERAATNEQERNNIR